MNVPLPPPFLTALRAAVLGAALPWAAAAPLQAEGGANYRLSPGDTLSIQVFQEDDLKTSARLAKDGTILFPLLGRIVLGGLTVDAAAQRIQDGLKDGYLVNPQVSISIEDYAPRRFAVLGQVQRPGSFEIPPEQRIDVFEAIALAGGFTDLADQGKVEIKRQIGGTNALLRVNVRSLSRTPAPSSVPIQPGDLITVRERLF